MKQTWTVVIGFIFFVIGLLSMILKLCGMQFIFMRFFQNTLGAYSTLIYLMMCIGGLMTVIISMNKTKIPEEMEN